MAGEYQAHLQDIGEMPDGSLLVSSNGTNEILKPFPDRGSAGSFINTKGVGRRDLGNCVCDERGNMWVLEIEGWRVWKFNQAGEPLLALGNGLAGFQDATVPFEQVQFRRIYDLRLGPDGDTYVPHCMDFSLRRINV